VDEETLEPSLSPEPTVEPQDWLTDVTAMTPSDVDVQLPAQLKAPPSTPLDAADGGGGCTGDRLRRVARPSPTVQTVQHGGGGMKALPRLKPCPFCGEALVKKSDHHGKWYGHRDEVGECWASIAQIHDEVDAKRWNARSEKALPASKGLKPRQIAFIDEYMKDRNATQAYIRAGYSEKGAQQSSAKLLLNAVVSAEIARRVEEYSRLAGIDKVWVLERYKAHVDAKLPDLFNDKGELLDPKDWPEHMQTLVHKVKVVQNKTGALIIDSQGAPILVPMYTKEVELESKLPALAKLLDFVVGIPVAPPVTKNFQLNVDKLLLQLRAPVPSE
jgi:phage terminase small subunit